MDFGLWFEPEMVNPDSDVVRAHPDWVLTPAARGWRGQVVLDVANPGAYAYLLERISALVDEVGIAYIKWDHNRDLHVAVGEHHGRAPACTSRPLAVYRLLDELRAATRGSRSSRAPRAAPAIDLGILRAHRPGLGVRLQRPARAAAHPALGGPAGAARARRLARRGHGLAHDEPRRVARACARSRPCSRHAGLELDVTKCTDDELAALTAWAAFYREVRGLLHSGDVVHADLPGDDVLLHGVVAHDRREALYAYVRLTTSAEEQTGRLLLPGLDPALEYEVVHRPEAGAASAVEKLRTPWFERGSARATGAVLGRVGLAAPRLDPAQAVVLHVRAL